MNPSFFKIAKLREELSALVLPADITSAEYDDVWRRRMALHREIAKIFQQWR